MASLEKLFPTEIHALHIISMQLRLKNTADPSACKQQWIINRIRASAMLLYKANSETLTFYWFPSSLSVDYQAVWVEIAVNVVLLKHWSTQTVNLSESGSDWKVGGQDRQKGAVGEGDV